MLAAKLPRKKYRKILQSYLAHKGEALNSVVRLSFEAVFQSCCSVRLLVSYSNINRNRNPNHNPNSNQRWKK